MTLTRIGLPAALAVLASVGCNRPAGTRAASSTSTSGATPALMAVGSPATPPTAEAFATDLLKAVNAGTATPDALAAAFKKVIAPPVFGSDEAAGYSEAGVADWLAGLKGKLPTPTLGPPAGSGDAAGFVATGPNTATLRAVKADGAWKADWLLVTPSAVVAPPPAGEPAFAAAAFLQAVAAPADRLAAAMMAPALRERIAPPFGSDKAGYNAGILAQRLSDLRGAATGFKVATADGGKVTAVSIGPGRPRTVTLTVEGGRVADWATD